MGLTLIFAGTPAFAAFTLTTLLASEHSVSAVYTQPDRPSGRGRKLTSSPVKQLALASGLPVYQPTSLNTPETIGILQEHQADVMVVVAYGQRLPQAVLQTPRYGCINIHASLLPRWRGAAPIERAIEAGDNTTGITIMQMDEHLDTGDILSQMYCPIDRCDTSASLSENLATLGAEALLKTLSAIGSQRLDPRPQDHSKASHAPKISKQEAEINWQLSAELLARKIRAFNPRPIAFTEINGNTLRIWEAQALDIQNVAAPGTVVSRSKKGIDVATGEGVLRLLMLQVAGGRAISAADLLNNQTIFK